MIQNIPIGAFLTKLSVTLKKDFTDEQLDFMSDFSVPTISFSSPGTGKTASAIAGLLTAELHHKIPGKNIYALSFTNMATIELGNRYEDALKPLGIRSSKINFQTLHSLCSSILKENHMKLGMNHLKVASYQDMEDLINLLIETGEEWDINVTKRNARNIVRAIESMNSSLVFDRAHVESKYDFKMAGIDFEGFTRLRLMLYKQSKMTEVIKVGDILLYTLELLLRCPEVAEAFQAKCRVLLVDEFQDLSLLQLRIISLLSKNVVAIGDIKQQIYAFNGACQEVVQEFYKYFPTAREVNLTKSFRCMDEIANYATALIKPNNMGGEDFKGIGPGGKARILKDINLAEICDKIEYDFRENRNTFPKSILFLFRNNFSAIPIAEELFKRKVPMRINKYTPANQIPVVRELCELVELAMSPHTLSNIKALQYLVPEYKFYRPYTNSPLFKIAAKEGCSAFEANVKFRDEGIGSKAMNLLIEVREALREGKLLSEVFNMLWPMFNSMYLKDREPYLEFPSTYYINLVTGLAKNKTYLQFVKDEVRKAEIIADCEKRRIGVRCYTFHASKGLEADIVYIISADADIIPSTAKLANMEKRDCLLEVAREIRNERSLVYVACTRAKEELYIAYDNSLSSMFSGINSYAKYDKIYQSNRPTYRDVEAFEEFFGGLNK